jgi:hypothetical protein
MAPARVIIIDNSDNYIVFLVDGNKIVYKKWLSRLKFQMITLFCIHRSANLLTYSEHLGPMNNSKYIHVRAN